MPNIPPRQYDIDEEFVWQGVEMILYVSGSFASEQIVIEFESSSGVWTPSAVTGDPGFVEVPKAVAVTGSPGTNSRIGNVGGGSGASLVLSIGDMPDNANLGFRKVREDAA